MPTSLWTPSRPAVAACHLLSGDYTRYMVTTRRLSSGVTGGASVMALMVVWPVGGAATCPATASR